MAIKRGISFKENEKNLVEYLDSKRDRSCYIKDLIQVDMEANGIDVKVEAPQKSANKVGKMLDF